MRKPILITVGGGGPFDPAPNATDCIVPSLVGQDCWIEKTGYGTYPYDGYQVLSAGGFRLVGGTTFNAGETWYIHQSDLAYGSAGGNRTNGFNLSAIMALLLNRIGWRQSTIPKYAILDSNNQISISLRYFNDFHALCTVPNLRDCQDNPEISNADFNAYLQSLQRSAIARCLNSVFQEPDDLEHVLLYERNTRIEQAADNTGLFVGYEIKVGQSFDIAVQIDSVRLYFDQHVTFPLYLFKDGKRSPIWTSTVTATAFEATIVDFSDLVLNYIGPETKGAMFYFGYFQTDLGSARAIREQVEGWNKTLCFCAGAITAPQTGPLLFNSSLRYITNVPYGLNLEMSSFRDHTAMITKRANVFDNAVGLQMVYNVLEQILYSTRSNDKERILKEGFGSAGVMLELKGAIPASDVAKTTGLSQKIETEIARLQKTFFPKPKGQTLNLGYAVYEDGPGWY
ncbi:hypothetical protein [Puia sp.]|jgi:hypothetical protein|uniref:hypothetical protein n=1 Tax=Puia sp. TaxID=2045100 RepID=UPI002F40E447